MNLKTQYFLYSLCLSILLLSACTSTTQLQVLQPAAFALPEDIETVATVNRSLPQKGFSNALEGLISGESIGQDRSGRRRAIEGLSDGLTRTPRFNVKFTSIEMKGRGDNRFPLPLSWKTVDSICQAYGADMVASLEKYDSDVSRIFSTTQTTRKDEDGNEYIETVVDAEMESTVHLGWRLYDPKRRQILDEFDIYEVQEAGASGGSEAEARNNLPDNYIVVNETSYGAGRRYGMRIAPTWVEVNREFYAKAKKDALMERAGRLARARKWEQAAETWKKLIAAGGDDKVLGKAAFNLAVASEALGHLEIAEDWARKAYTDYGFKRARRYQEMLRMRIYDQGILQEQLGSR